jgi:hypothetical protein
LIRASPADFYLKYLITHPEDYRDHQIRTLVKLQQLDFLGMPHLSRLREECVRPNPFYPEDLTHHPSQRFLVKERIHSLWHMDKDSIQAAKLVDHPRAKELAEALILSDAEPLWISGMLKRRQNFTATERAITLYKHYYFNIDLVDRTEIQAIINMRAVVDSEGDSDAAEYKRAYWKAAKDDLRKLSAGMALTPMASAMNLMRLGIMPKGIDVARIATVGRLAALIQSSAASVNGKAKTALDFALTAKMMTEIMDSVGDASGDFQQSLMKMVLDTDAAPVPSIQQVTSGNYTLDIIPREKGAKAELTLDGEGEDDAPI